MPSTRETRGARIEARRKPLLRAATAGDAEAIDELIDQHAAEGRLLPRRREEIAAHASRFIVAVQGQRVVA